jgi:hypothetical protein
MINYCVRIVTQHILRLIIYLYLRRLLGALVDRADVRKKVYKIKTYSNLRTLQQIII